MIEINGFSERKEDPDKVGTYIRKIVRYCILNIVISIGLFFWLDSEPSVLYDDIIANWQTKAILDIKTSFDDCPAGYESAYEYKWPGTVSGCWCGELSSATKKSSGIKSDLSTGECSQTQKQAGCQNVQPTSSKTLNKWSAVNGTPINLCVKRSNECFFQNSLLQENDTCPTNMIACGSYFCTSGPKCPISNIQMKNLTLPSDSSSLSACLNSPSCVVIAQNSSSALILNYQNEKTSGLLPISQLRLNEYGMCYDTNQDDLTPGRENYGLLKKPRSNCRQEAASFWTKSNLHISEAQLFELNDLTQVTQNLKNFGYYSNGHTGDDYQYHLFSRAYAPWNTQCKSMFQDYLNIRPTLAKLKLNQLILTIITVIIGLIIIKYVPKRMRQCEDSHELFSMKDVIFGGCLGWIFKITQFGAVCYVSFDSMFKVFSMCYSLVDKEDCTTDEVRNPVRNLMHNLHIGFYGNVVVLHFAIMILIANFGFFFALELNIAVNGNQKIQKPVNGRDRKQDEKKPKHKVDSEFQPKKNYSKNAFEENEIHKPLLAAPPAPRDSNPKNEYGYAKQTYQPYYISDGKMETVDSKL